MEPTTIGVVMIGLMFVLLIVGVPIGFAMGIAALGHLDNLDLLSCPGVEDVD